MMGVTVFGILKIPEGLGRSSSGICLLLVFLLFYGAEVVALDGRVFKKVDARDFAQEVFLAGVEYFLGEVTGIYQVGYLKLYAHINFSVDVAVGCFAMVY